MTARLTPIEIEQGATFEFSFRWCLDSVSDPGTPGDPIDLTNSVLRMQIRKSQQSPVLVEATNEGANAYITHNGAGGVVTVKLPAVETNKLSVAKPKYDLEVVLPGGDVYRLIEGPVTVSPNITQVAGELRVK